MRAYRIMCSPNRAQPDTWVPSLPTGWIVQPLALPWPRNISSRDSMPGSSTSCDFRTCVTLHRPGAPIRPPCPLDARFSCRTVIPQMQRPGAFTSTSNAAKAHISLLQPRARSKCSIPRMTSNKMPLSTTHIFPLLHKSHRTCGRMMRRMDAKKRRSQRVRLKSATLLTALFHGCSPSRTVRFRCRTVLPGGHVLPVEHPCRCRCAGHPIKTQSCICGTGQLRSLTRQILLPTCSFAGIP